MEKSIVKINIQDMELHPNIYMIKGEDTSSHSYLIRGDYKNVIIDSGVDRNFHKLQESLLTLGFKLRDIDIVINTHAHFDHIGANRYFQDHSLIAAHRLAAVKISVEDRYVTMYKSGDMNEPSPRVHLWMENGLRLDIGNYILEIIHTPGHTSGSICIYELTHQILFSGDTIFSEGVLSYISESGSIGDYINSIDILATRKIKKLYPGHGAVSNTPEEDMSRAIINARNFLENEERIDITHIRESS